MAAAAAAMPVVLVEAAAAGGRVAMAGILAAIAAVATGVETASSLPLALHFAGLL